MKRFFMAGAVFAWVCLEAAGAAFRIDGTELLRSRHMDLIPAADSEPQNAAVRQVGSQRSFYAYDFPRARNYLVPSTLRAVGDYCYVYVEDSEWAEGRVLQADADAALSAFEKRTPSDASRGAYQILTEAFGPPPDIDGDPRIVLLLLDIRDWHTGPGSGFISGYFHQLNQTRQRFSNETEMLYIDTDPQDLSDPESFRNAAHEFQHLLHTARDWDEEHWLNEGMSGLAESLCGYDISLYINAFQNDPSGSLTRWPKNGGRLADYGRTYLWTLYLYERYGGISTIQEIVRNPRNGMPTVDAALRNLGVGATASSVYLDWIAALAADDSRHENGRYSIQIADIQAAPTRAHFRYPTAETRGSLLGWEAQYIEFHPPADGAGSLFVKIDAPIDLKAQALLFDGNRLADVRNIDMINGFGEAYDRVVVALGYHPASDQESETVSYAYSASVGLVDEDRPTVSITGPQTVQRGVFQIDIAFNEDVVGFERDDLVVVNGTAAGFSGARDTYRASIDPIGSGAVQVSVPENAAHDIAGNGNVASNVFSVEARKVAQLLVAAGAVQNMDGTPAPGLEVALQNVSTQSAEVLAPDLTDAQGRYSITLFHVNGVVESGQTIAARAYADVNGTRTLVGELEHVITDADIDAASVQLNIQVEIPKPRPPAFVVSGVVTDMDGSPAEGVMVEGENASTRSDTFAAAGPTDASGNYTIAFFDPSGVVGEGETIAVYAYADVNGARTLVGDAEHVVTEAEIDTASAQLDIQVEIPKPRPPAFVLSGVVAETDGSPAEGVMVEGENASTKSDTFAAAGPTDASGNYTIAFFDLSGFVGEGETIAVRAYADVNGARTLVGDAEHVVTEAEIDTASAQLDIQVEIPKPRPPAFVLSGVVAETDGSPAEGVMVEGENASTKSDTFAAAGPTDASGNYTIAFFDSSGFVGEGETIAVRAYADVNGARTLVGDAEHVVTEAEIDTASAQLDIQVEIPKPRPPAFVLSGVVAEMDGSPAEGVMVEGENASTRSDTFAAAGPTDASGNYTIAFFDPSGVVGEGETIAVYAYADVNGARTLVGDAEHVVTEAEIDTASAQLDIEVEIPQPPAVFALSGAAFTLDGIPAAGLHITVQNETAQTEEFEAAAPTDAEGMFAAALTGAAVEEGDALIVRAYEIIDGERTLVGERTHTATKAEAEASEASVDLTINRLAHGGAVLATAFSPDGRLFATGGADRTPRIWQVQPRRLLFSLPGHTGSVAAVAFSPDGQTLASGSYDGSARIWNVQTGALVRELPGHTDRLYAAAFSPDGQTLATGGADRAIKLWRASDGKLLKTMTEHAGPVLAVAYAPDGQTIASGSADRTFKLWSADGKMIYSQKRHGRAVRSAAFSPDGQTIATGSSDETIRFWNAADGRHLLTVGGGGTGLVHSAAFSPDGQTLASAHHDGTIWLWAAGNGRRKRVLEGHTGTVYTIAFSPDGQTLLSGSRDRTFRFWHTPPPRVDVNGDGVVDFADLALAAAQYGQTENITADVNGDGVVDILDILLIADAIDQAAGWFAAPPAHAAAAFSSAHLDEAARWFADAERLVVKGSASRRGEAALRALLAAHAVSLPARSSLLPSYPNPFNPETWIPFDLSEASDVRLTIYNADGAVVREMDLGALPAGSYRSRVRAAYWDGRNNLGERAASGIYFVRIEAGGYTALRRMVLLK